jgi:hypothetical protein
VCIRNYTFLTFLPFIGTIATVLAAFAGISMKIKKDRKAKWIDEFRSEVANFTSIAMTSTKDDIDTLKKIAYCGNRLLLYLELDKQEHFDLIEVIATVVREISADFESHRKNYPEQQSDIMRRAIVIINTEQRKVNRLFW